MRQVIGGTGSTGRQRSTWQLILMVLMALGFSGVARAGETDLISPDLSGAHFLGGIDGHKLLLGGLIICLGGIAFGIWVEPEMVNPSSELFENHPDWVISLPHRRHRLQRTGARHRRGRATAGGTGVAIRAEGLTIPTWIPACSRHPGCTA